MRKAFSYLIFSCLCCKLLAGTITGKVSDVDNSPIPGATVLIVGTAFGAVTDPQGIFQIKVTEGSYTINISSLGFKSVSREVQVPSRGKVSINITLEESVSELAEVVVQDKTVERMKMEQPIKMEAIAVDKVLQRATNVSEMINQVSGVKVRQASGVGSNTIVNINGLQGRAVRFFRNGIPTDYLGSAFQIGLVPTSIIKNVEIYKGVLPIDLGADALGGAINIVTQGKDRQFLDASYEIGSFNTHQVNVNANYIVPKRKLHIGVSGYLVHSDNDYPFDVDINTRGVTESFRVRRFHDAITARFGEVSVGVHDTKFADLLDLQFSYFQSDSEVQNGVQINPNQAFGEVVRAETNAIISLQYSKRLLPQWEINFFGAISRRDTKEEDLSDFLYDWFGITDRVTASGEVQLRDQRLDIDTRVARMGTQYDFNDRFNLKFSTTYNSFEQVGSDPFAAENLVTGIQPITVPATYTKVVSGIGLGSSFIGGKLKGETFVKHYYLSTEAPSTLTDNLTENLSRTNFGWGQSFKFGFDDDTYARISYEDATRIPEAVEYFGDYLFLLPNPSLEPERSDNVNLGFASNLNASSTLSAEVNLFYRDTKDFIRIFPQNLITSIHDNSDTQITKGVETNFRWKLDGGSDIRVAVTYQDLRRTDTRGTDAILEDSRTPNIPYFFTNLSANRRFDAPFGWKADFNLYGNYLFTEKYLVLATPKAVEPAVFGEVLPAVESSVIDAQHQVNLGLTCNLKDIPFSLNAEVINVLNNELYDNFRIPKPPRNYRFKITYRLSK